MNIAVWLPRTAQSVAVARATLDHILAQFGVHPDCREEIALAVSEACSNAVRHAHGQPEYQLLAESHDSQCVITINDDGPGLPADRPHLMPAPGASDGRGLAIMNIATDHVELHRRDSGGLSVRMSKRLHWSPGAIGSPVQ